MLEFPKSALKSLEFVNVDLYCVHINICMHYYGINDVLKLKTRKYRVKTCKYCSRNCRVNITLCGHCRASFLRFRSGELSCGNFCVFFAKIALKSSVG